MLFFIDIGDLLPYNLVQRHKPAPSGVTGHRDYYCNTAARQDTTYGHGKNGLD